MSWRFFRQLGWLVCAWTAAGLPAADAPPTVAEDDAQREVRYLSLADCLHLALEHNLELMAARLDPEIQRHLLGVARSAYDPTFDISSNRRSSVSPGGFDEQNRPFEGTTTENETHRVGLGARLPTGGSVNVGVDLADTSGTNPFGPFENASGSASVSLRQPLLRNALIDGLRVSLRRAHSQLAVSELGLRERIMDVLTSVETAYYDLLLARQRVVVQEQAVELAERLLAGNRRRVEVGTQAQLDEQLAEARVAASKAQLLGVQGNLLAQEYQLKRLLSENFLEWADVRIVPTEALTVAPRELNIGESWSLALKHRPDLQQHRLSLELEGYELKWIKNQTLPQLDVVASYAQLGSGVDPRTALRNVEDGDNSVHSVGLVLSVPIGNRSARNSYRASKARHERSLLEYKRAEQDVMIQIGTTLEQARIGLAQVEATALSRRSAEISLAGEQRMLENGRTTGFIVLESQRNLTDARLAELSALAAYNKLLASLARQEGMTLERNRALLGGE